jgi:hypothetical protein
MGRLLFAPSHARGALSAVWAGPGQKTCAFATTAAPTGWAELNVDVPTYLVGRLPKTQSPKTAR